MCSIYIYIYYRLLYTLHVQCLCPLRQYMETGTLPTCICRPRCGGSLCQHHIICSKIVVDEQLYPLPVYIYIVVCMYSYVQICCLSILNVEFNVWNCSDRPRPFEWQKIMLDRLDFEIPKCETTPCIHICFQHATYIPHS